MEYSKNSVTSFELPFRANLWVFALSDEDSDFDEGILADLG